MTTLLLFLTIVAWPIAILSTPVLVVALWVFFTAIRPTYINDSLYCIVFAFMPSLVSNAWLLTYYLS